MSQFVTVSETLRSRSPELARRMGEVRVATLDSERERVFRFRYSIYVDELGRGVGTVDPLRGSLRDAEDDENETTILYIADADGLLTGTARIRCWGPGGPPFDVRSRFTMDLFAGLEGMGTAEIGRVMLHPNSRGGSGFQALIGAAFQLAASEHGVDACFLICLSGLVASYRRLGFRPYAAPLVPGVDGLTVPLVFLLCDSSGLERLDSPLAPVLDACCWPPGRHAAAIAAWSKLFDPAALPLQFNSEAILERVRDDNDHSAFLQALDERTVRKLVDHGFLLSVRGGQVLTRQGVIQRELFVVIEGAIAIADHDHHLRTIGPGEVVGEVGFFASTHRRSATVTAQTDGQVLVVTRRWLDEMKESDPRAAADILFELARALADRVAHPPGEQGLSAPSRGPGSIGQAH